MKLQKSYAYCGSGILCLSGRCVKWNRPNVTEFLTHTI